MKKTSFTLPPSKHNALYAVISVNCNCMHITSRIGAATPHSRTVSNVYCTLYNVYNIQSTSTHVPIIPLGSPLNVLNDLHDYDK